MHIQEMPIVDLKTHPLQGEIYFELSEIEFEALKADIEENELRDPIEVAADGTIIDGHQRVEVFKQLGREAISAVVVDDTLTETELTDRYLKRNLTRRQLDKLGIARVVRAQTKQECKEKGTFDFEDRFLNNLMRAFAYSCSERTAKRYMKLVELPNLIQVAVSSGQLQLTTALKFTSISNHEQELILNKTESGENIKKLFKQYVPPPVPATHKKSADLEWNCDLNQKFIKDCSELATKATDLKELHGSCDRTKICSDALFKTIREAVAILADIQVDMRRALGEQSSQ